MWRSSSYKEVGSSTNTSKHKTNNTNICCFKKRKKKKTSNIRDIRLALWLGEGVKDWNDKEVEGSIPIPNIKLAILTFVVSKEKTSNIHMADNNL
jgi:hypothetical protein